MAEQTTKLWTTSSLIKLFIGAIIGLLYFSYIFIPQHSNNYNIALNSFNVEKKNTSSALKGVKEYASGTPVIETYNNSRKKKQIAFDNLKKERVSEEVLGFKSLHFFWERFGGNTTNLIFGCWVLFMFLTNSKPKVWSYLFIGFYLSTKVFIYFWIFHAFQDFHIITYILMILLCTYLVMLCTYLWVKSRKDKIDIVIKQRNNIAQAALFNTKESVQEEVYDTIKENLQ